MNTGWSGPSPRPVVEAIRERLEYESYHGPTSPPVLTSDAETHRQAIDAAASLLNVSPQEVCLTQNTTDGLNIVINGLPWQEGDEVITFAPEHSSVLIPAYSLRRRLGVQVKVLPLAPDEVPGSIVEKVEAAITPRTRLVFFSHIQYTSGLRMPVDAIREVTRPRGIRMLLDGAQTAGHIALDLRAMDCDFYSVPAQKWLLGPDGVGALYIRQDVIEEVQPVRVAGWAARSYDQQGNYEPNVASMDKFRLTSRSAPLSAGFGEAIRFVQKSGMEAVEERVAFLAQRLKLMLSDVPGVTVVSPMSADISSGLTSFQIRGVSPGDAVIRLWERHKIVARQITELAGVRISTHFFNTEDELAELVGAVREMARNPSR